MPGSNNLTLHKLKAELAAREVKAPHDTVWQFLRREGLRFKKFGETRVALAPDHHAHGIVGTGIFPVAESRDLLEIAGLEDEGTSSFPAPRLLTWGPDVGPDEPACRRWPAMRP